jgi:hypothetical protein
MTIVVSAIDESFDFFVVAKAMIPEYLDYGDLTSQYRS